MSVCKLTVPLLLLAAVPVFSQNVITTVAGRDWIYPPPGGAAVTAPLSNVTSVALDLSGNLYIADPQNNVVLKVDGSGVVSTFAGNGIQGFSGEGGLAINASLYFPRGVALDNAGNLYITEQGNERIRRVSRDGIIRTIAGNGQRGFTGDGKAAVSATIQDPAGIVVDGAGNIYFSDSTNNRVRKIDANGVITTVAGNGRVGFAGDNGAAIQASLNNPDALALDTSNNLYISDYNNFRIRKVTPAGTISTVAGTGNFGFTGDGGPATSAFISSAAGITIDPSSGNLLFSDTSNCVIRQINPSGVISTVAGNRQCTFSGDGAAAGTASFWYPAELALAPGGVIYVADRGNQRVRRFSINGLVQTVAGNGSFRVSDPSATPTQTYLFAPQGIAIAPSAGDLVIAESRANAIRDISVTGVVKKLAGLSLVGGYTRDGLSGASTLLNTPYGIATGFDGSIYYADTYNNVIRRVATDGTVSTVAGRYSPIGAFGGDTGPGVAASLNTPLAVVVDLSGNIYIADTSNNRIRKVDPGGFISTFAGNGTAGYSGDGGAAAAASINNPIGMVFDKQNNLYFADTGNHRIRKIAPNSIITTIAGTGVGGTPNGDGGAALSAIVNSPFGLALDSAGNLYYSEYNDHVVRRVDTRGIVTTVAGNGRPGLTGDGGIATAALLNQPAGLAVDSSGVLYIADSANDRIRAVTPVKPSLLLSTNNITLSATGGLTNNQTTPVTVSAVLANAPLTGLGYAVTVSSDSKWLTVTPTTGTLPQTLLVTTDASALITGAYVGTVTITAPGASPPSISISVNVTVAAVAPPVLTSDTTGLSLSVTQGAAPFSSNISLSNGGVGTINFQATVQTVSGGNWLSVNAPSGTFGNAAPYPLVITTNPTNLAPGIYRGIVTAGGTSSRGTITPISIPVALAVTDANHEIQLSQTALAFTTISGGSSPLSQSFGISDLGQGSMNWSAGVVSGTGAPISWLVLSAANGNTSTTGSQLSASIVPGRLGNGDYYAKIQIASDADNSPQTVSVLLTIKSANTLPFVDLESTALVFTGAAGTVPGSKAVRIAAVGPAAGGSVSYTSTSLTGDGTAWLVHSPRSNTLQVNQPNRIVVQPDFSLLSPGTYNGIITLSVSDGSTRTIKVLSVVTAGSSGQSISLNSLQPNASCSTGLLRVQFTPPQLQGSNTFTALAGQQNTLRASAIGDCDGKVFGSANGQISAYFNDGEKALPMTFNAGDGTWTATWTPPDMNKSPVSIVLVATGVTGISPLAGQSDKFVGTLLPGSRVPQVFPFGVVSAASSQANVPIGVGGLISIYGNQLIDGSTGQAGTVPLPNTISGTQVLLENVAVPILYASNSQINIQVPYEVDVNVPQHLVVQRSGALSAPFTIQVAALQPAIFLSSAGPAGQAIIVNANTNAIADPSHPVTGGDVIIIYCTGLGPTSPSVPTGAAATVASYANNIVTATIGGKPATLYYAGLTPGFPGLYQINGAVPAGVTGNSVPVIVTTGGQVSPPANMAIK